MENMQKLLLTFVLLSLFLVPGKSQENTDIDKLFYEAKELTQQKSYTEARAKARIILNLAPYYQDARILIARSYAWEGNYDSARIEIKTVLQASPDYIDAILAAIDFEYWQKEYDKALEYVEYGLDRHPDNRDFLVRKAQIFMAIGKEREAKIILTRLLRVNPYDYQVNSLLGGEKFYRNRLIAEHTLDVFTQPYKHIWQVASLQYQHESYWGTWIGKINAGDYTIDDKRYKYGEEFQLEADAYPVITTTSYLYLNYGYSWGKFFPTHRFGIEYFESFKKGWEASFGCRFLNFRSDGMNSNTAIITGSVGKYFINNWVSFRPFYVFSNQKFSQSYYLFYRHFLNDPINYIGGAVGFGSSPDEGINRNSTVFQSTFESFRVRFDYQHKLGNRFIMRLLIGNNIDKYNSNSYRYRFDSNIYLAWLF
jgi:YaiO family outer membrane protein